MKLSVIIPAYKEPHLQKTIDSLLQASQLGDQLEVLAILDGPWLESAIKEDPRLKLIQLEKNLGMRGAINTGLKQAKGEYIMKVDAHCLFDTGFDKIMIESCKSHCLMIPRKYSLDDINWTRDRNRPAIDYYYFEYPHTTKYGQGLAVLYGDSKPYKQIDDTMTFQGSCWLANRKYFMQRVGFLDDNPNTYGPFVGEQHEIGLKYWLGGGQVKVNKNTWYAHLFKRNIHYMSGKYDREYKTAPNTADRHTWVAKHWMYDKEPGMIHPFSWLIEKFSPVPGWPIIRKS